MKSKKIELSQESRAGMIEKIKKYFINERDEEIGDLGAIILLDFITENLAKVFYNKGVEDCIVQLSLNVEDLKGLEL